MCNLLSADMDGDRLRRTTQGSTHLFKSLCVCTHHDGITDDLSLGEALGHGTVDVVPCDTARCSEVVSILPVTRVFVSYDLA